MRAHFRASTNYGGSALHSTPHEANLSKQPCTSWLTATPQPPPEAAEPVLCHLPGPFQQLLILHPGLEGLVLGVRQVLRPCLKVHVYNKYTPDSDLTTLVLPRRYGGWCFGKVLSRARVRACSCTPALPLRSGRAGMPPPSTHCRIARLQIDPQLMLTHGLSNEPWCGHPDCCQGCQDMHLSFQHCP